MVSSGCAVDQYLDGAFMYSTSFTLLYFINEKLHLHYYLNSIIIHFCDVFLIARFAIDRHLQSFSSVPLVWCGLIASHHLWSMQVNRSSWPVFHSHLINPLSMYSIFNSVSLNLWYVYLKRESRVLQIFGRSYRYSFFFSLR